jgi:hypothetical protein
MRRLMNSLQFFATILSVLAPVFGGEESELDRVFHFIKANAVNRTLVMEKKGELAGGRVGYTFLRESTLCNLVRSDNRLQYDIVFVIKQKKWDITDGKREGEPRTEDRILVVRYELGLKKSTGEVIGHTEIITTTRAEWGGGTEAIRLKVLDGRLVVERRTSLYEDYFDQGSTFYPGATEEEQQWRLENGKLICESRSKVFKVNPKTLERELVDDRLASIEKEGGRLPLE